MGTFGELDGNTLGRTKNEKFPLPPHPHPKNQRKINKTLPSFSLDVSNFYFQNRSSPFST
jgi:hypothetical protein